MYRRCTFFDALPPLLLFLGASLSPPSPSTVPTTASQVKYPFDVLVTHPVTRPLPPLQTLMGGISFSLSPTVVGLSFIVSTSVSPQFYQSFPRVNMKIISPHHSPPVGAGILGYFRFYETPAVVAHGDTLEAAQAIEARVRAGEEIDWDKMPKTFRLFR